MAVKENLDGRSLSDFRRYNVPEGKLFTKRGFKMPEKKTEPKLFRPVRSLLNVQIVIHLLAYLIWGSICLKP